MKGDFTRSTFRQTKHYSGVRMQQGRVQLDADWNEQGDIQAHRDRTATLDAIGEHGGPLDAAGFGLAASSSDLPADQQSAGAKLEPLTPGDLLIAAGRYYVDGILCENDAPTTLTNQPDGLRGGLPSAAGDYVAILDVWERHLTALDDPEILEVALGGADTATRTRTVCQVRVIKTTEVADETRTSTGRLSARAEPAEPDEDEPCLVTPEAGYRRLENQLYRVEIHDRNEPGTATFKWSRDNGSVEAAWLIQSGNVLTLSSLGRDSTHGFAAGDWVELIDDSHELQGQPGTIVKVTKAEGQTITIDPGGQPIDIDAFPRRPKVRRWDMGAEGLQTVEVDADTDVFLELEDGVQVRFEPGTYATGDYWMIPARTGTANVEWPFDEPQPPHGIAHRYALVARLTFDGSQYTSIEDLRRPFPPLSELTSLFYVGGGGQLGTPGGTLAQPVQAGVAKGERPVAGAIVRFKIARGTGTLQTGDTTVDIPTGPDGVASCTWTLGPGSPDQQVEAALLDAAEKPVHLPVRFSATFSPDARDPGMQIQKILGGGGSTVLENDRDIAVDRFGAGIDIACSAPVAAGTASPATCFVTMEVPYPVTTGDTVFWGTTLLGFQPLIVTGTVRVDGTVIAWRPSTAVTAWLEKQLFGQLGILNRTSRILTRLTILGNFIWQANRPELFLDAEAFGQRKIPNPAEPTGVLLPSGDGRRGGRLDMWFWVVPKITVAISPEQVSVRIVRQGFSVPVSFTVTIDGASDARAELSVNGVVGGNATDGTITLTDEKEGLWTYRSPTRSPLLTRVVTVEAVSLADRTRVARAFVTLVGGIDFDPDFPDLPVADAPPPKPAAPAAKTRRTPARGRGAPARKGTK